MLLAIALAAGCAKKPDDAALVTNIKSQMFSDSQLQGVSLQVASSGGQVTLSGTVPSDAARYEAYKIATQTPGVSKVNDQMTVQVAQVAPPAEPPASVPVAAAAAAPPPQPVIRREPKPRRRHHDAAPIETANNVPPGYPQQDAQTPPLPPPPQQPIDQTPPSPPAAPPTPPAPVLPPPPQPKSVTIPASSTLTIRMIDGVDSSVNQPGEIFHASLEAPIVVDNEVAIPKGADVYVRLASAASAGRLTGKSELHLELIKIEYQGRSYPLVSSTYSVTGSSRGKNTAEKVGGGAALGAIIGALAGGGKGAAIGAGVGAGAGGVYQGATRGKQVKVPSETKLDFQLDQPVTVTVMPRAAHAQ